jgi:pyruvate/2-oxoglutarate dehydrogenase complex dihydrolipoamide dehydrogenase (E3) component
VSNYFDLIILGGGPAGLVASKVARGFGKTVAIIEKNKLGGECTWTGCVPSKALIHYASLVSSVEELQKHGVSITRPTFDTIMTLVKSKREEIYKTHTPEVLKKENITTYFGAPEFIDKHTVRIGDQLLKAQKFIIATGSQPFIPPIEGLQDVKFLTNETLFELEKLPQSMIILGAGPIGVEMACALNKFGVKVTIIEMSAYVLPKEDPELSSMLKEKMISEGIDIRTSLKLVKVVQDDTQIKGIAQDLKQQLVEVSAASLLIAVGRKPNLDGLSLERVGVATTNKAVVVNNKLQTTVANIYACGDIVGPYQFSHMAEYQAVIAATNAFLPLFKRRLNYENVIWVTFSDPEFASAGLTEEQAREKHGNSIAVYRIQYDALDRPKIDNKTFGLCKVICTKKGKILGAHILGERAGELIHELQVGKYYNYTLPDFYKPIHAYPTYSELIWHMAKRAYVQNLTKKWYIKLLKKFF